MRLIHLVIINIKRYIKNPLILGMIFLFPVGILIAMFGSSSSLDDYNIGVIDMDNSQYSYELKEELAEHYTIVDCTGNPEENYEKINQNEIGVLYVIGEGFENSITNGEAPKILAYKQEAAAGTIIAEDSIEKFIKGNLEEGVNSGLSVNYIDTIIEVDKTNDKKTFVMAVIMICYFMMIGASMIAQDIIMLKKQKVLRRTISTANSDMEILGGVFIATFILQTILSSLAYIVTAPFLNIQNGSIQIAVLAIALCSFVTTALVAAATRWLKDATLANLGVVLFGLLSFGLAMVNIELSMFENVPAAISGLSVISPFYWILKVLQDGEIIVPILVIALMSGVFFTAGSFRLRDFVKE